jgi:hypothetical protein
MVLSKEDAQRLRGMMLTGWKTESDLYKGWASLGERKNLAPQRARGGEAGEQAHAKSLHVKVGRRVTCLNVLFDKSVPDTMIRYGTAAKVGLRADEYCEWVTTVDGKREYCKGLYCMPLLDAEGYGQLIKANGVRSAAHIETGRTVRGNCGNHSDMERGTTRVTWEWERADMVIGWDNLHCKPELFRGWPKEGTKLEVMRPMGLYTRKDLGEFNRRN